MAIPDLPFDNLSINFNYWILQSIAMALTCFLIRGLSLSSPLGAVFMVVGLAYVNSALWDAALFFKIPDRVSLQVLTLLAANGAIFWLVAKLLPGIEISGILPALLAPLVFTLSSVLIANHLQDIDWVALGKSGISKVVAFKDSLQAPLPHPTPSP